MSDTKIQDGRAMAVSGLAASKSAGELHVVGGYVGILVTDVRGTGDDYNTAAVQGFPLSDGVGSGKGDIELEGVWAVPVVNGVTPAVGDPVFNDGTAKTVSATNTEHLVGHVWPQDDGSGYRAYVAGSDPAVLNQGQTNVVYVKLYGRPKAVA